MSEAGAGDPQVRIGALRAEVADLRDRVSRHPRELAALEKRLAEARSDARSVAAQNERLARTLRDAKDRIVSLKSQLDALGAPPLTFGILDTLLPAEPDAELRLADIQTANRKVRTSVADDVPADSLVPGSQVLLNESLVIVGTVPVPQSGEITALSRTSCPTGSGRSSPRTRTRNSSSACRRRSPNSRCGRVIC